MTCIICGKEVEKLKKGTFRKTCSPECLSKQKSLNGTKNVQKKRINVYKKDFYVGF